MRRCRRVSNGVTSIGLESAEAWPARRDAGTSTSAGAAGDDHLRGEEAAETDIAGEDSTRMAMAMARIGSLMRAGERRERRAP